MSEFFRDFEDGIESAARQLETMVAALEEGRPAWDTLTAHHGGDIRLLSLSMQGPERSFELAQEAIRTTHASARIATTVVRSTVTAADGVDIPAFQIRIEKPGTPHVVGLLLAFIEQGREVRLAPDLELLEANVPAEIAGRLIEAITKAMTRPDRLGTRATLPAGVIVSLGRHFWPPPDAPPFEQNVVYLVNVVGEAVLAALTIAGGGELHVGPVNRLLTGEALPPGSQFGNYARNVTAAGMVPLLEEIAGRTWAANLLGVGAGVHLLGLMNPSQIEAEKRALFAFASEVVQVPTASREACESGLRQLAAVLGLDVPEEAKAAGFTPEDDALLRVGTASLEPRGRPVLLLGPVRRLLLSLRGDLPVLVEGEDGALLNPATDYGGLVRDGRGERFTHEEDAAERALKLTSIGFSGWHDNPPMTAAELLAAVASDPDGLRLLVDGTDEDERLAYEHAHWDDDEDDDDEDDDDTEPAVNGALLLVPITDGPTPRLARAAGEGVRVAVVAFRRVPDDAAELERRARSLLG